MEVIRQIVAVKNHHIELELPVEFTSQEAEVIVLSIDNTKEESEKKKFDPKLFRGSISKETAEAMIKEIEESRNEWERDI